MVCRLMSMSGPHGLAADRGPAIYLASKDGYDNSVLPSGLHAGAPRRRWTAPADCTSTTPAPGRNPSPPTRPRPPTW
jgi:hypothetical protein